MVDSAAVLVELAELITSKPNWGRQELLAQIAQLQAKHFAPEDEMDRALRLIAPRIRELIFNRDPELAQLLLAAGQEAREPVGDGSPARGSGAVHPSMAAA